MIINRGLEIQFLHSFKDSFTRNSCYKYNKEKFPQLLGISTSYCFSKLSIYSFHFKRMHKDKYNWIIHPLKLEIGIHRLYFPDRSFKIISGYELHQNQT